MANVYEKLLNIQSKLAVPKDNVNEFGGYKYRSCEDILESLKPILAENKAAVTITDEMILIGERYYVKSTATFIDTEKGEKIEVSAYAREDERKKGMDLSQLTGSTSSYARKYALNGLFAIDDTKDSDYTNKHGKEQGQAKDNKKDKDKQAIVDASLASDKQLNFIYKLSEQKGFVKTMPGYIKQTYGKDTSRALTKKEASEIIKMLQEIGEKQE